MSTLSVALGKRSLIFVLVGSHGTNLSVVLAMEAYALDPIWSAVSQDIKEPQRHVARLYSLRFPTNLSRTGRTTPLYGEAISLLPIVLLYSILLSYI